MLYFQYMWGSFLEFFYWLIGIGYWIVLPIGVGIFLLPFTPYLIKKFVNKKKKALPSFIPFWTIILSFVLITNWIWGTFFNGWLYYEWDTMFTSYTLVNYDHPVLDSIIKNPNLSSSRMFYGLQVWDLYFLWLGLTLAIYSTATIAALWHSRKEQNFLLYRKILFISLGIMLTVSLLTTPVLAYFFSNGNLHAWSLSVLGK